MPEGIEVSHEAHMKMVEKGLDQAIAMLESGEEPQKIIEVLKGLKQEEEKEEELEGKGEPDAKEELMDIFKKAKEAETNE